MCCVTPWRGGACRLVFSPGPGSVRRRSFAGRRRAPDARRDHHRIRTRRARQPAIAAGYGASDARTAPSLNAAEKPQDLQELLYSAARLLGACLRFDRVTIAPIEDGPEYARARTTVSTTSLSAAPQSRKSALRGLMAEYVADLGNLLANPDHSRHRRHSERLAFDGKFKRRVARFEPRLVAGRFHGREKCLRELGASACLLLPITVDGALWGLVACLNRAAGLPSQESRAIAELVVRFLSLRVRIALPPSTIRAGFLAEAPIASPPSAKAAGRRTRKGRRAKNHDPSRDHLLTSRH